MSSRPISGTPPAGNLRSHLGPALTLAWVMFQIRMKEDKLMDVVIKSSKASTYTIQVQWFGRSNLDHNAFRGKALTKLSDNLTDAEVAKTAYDHAWAMAAALSAPAGVGWGDSTTHVQMCLYGLAT